VFFELLRCCFQVLWPAYPLLWVWQWAFDKWSTLPLPISQIISCHTPTLSSSICPCDDDSTCPIRLMKHIVFVLKDSYSLTWPMTFTVQKWYTICNLLIQDYPHLAVQQLWEGCVSLQLRFVVFEIRLQYTISWITFTTIMTYWQNL
jgi:hypothetical protein